MQFGGPQSSDYRNVRALNRAFLTLLTVHPSYLGSMSAEQVEQFKSLARGDRERLARTPFLLLSLREWDHPFWEHTLAGSADPDLFRSGGSPPPDYASLSAAALGFAWQLSRQNPYAARLIFGASLHWCEMLAEQTLFGLLALVANAGDVLCTRAAADSQLWGTLLARGIRRESEVRQAAQLAALQAVLTRPVVPPAESWPLAACENRTPASQLAADDRETSC